MTGTRIKKETPFGVDAQNNSRSNSVLKSKSGFLNDI